jgi:2-iminoacetate synthase
MEYLLDYATPETRRVGEELVNKELSTLENSVQRISKRLVDEVKADKRDVYV